MIPNREKVTRLANVLLLAALAVVAQDISSLIVRRLDMTAKSLHSLSQTSKKILAGLDGSPLVATVFTEENDESRTVIERLLAIYQAEYPALKAVYVSPSKNPAAVEKYRVSSHETLVLRYHEKDVKVSGFSEDNLSGGLLRLIKPRRPAVRFTAGHGEKNPAKELRILSSSLGTENYEILDLSIQKETTIPPGTDCIVVAGPKDPFLPREIEILEDYFLRGGRLLLMLDPYNDGGFSPFLKKLGIGLSEDAVVDKRSRLFRGDALFPMSFEYPSHAVTRGLNRVSMFPVARSLRLGTPSLSKVELSPLALSSETAWSEHDRSSLADETAAFDPAKDKAGPLVFAAAALLRAESSKDDGYLVVFGDSDFITDAYVTIADNQNLFLNSLAWLVGSDERLGLRPRDPDHSPIRLSELEAFVVSLIVLVVLPGVFALAGLGVWLKRRKEP